MVMKLTPNLEETTVQGIDMKSIIYRTRLTKSTRYVQIKTIAILL